MNVVRLYTCPYFIDGKCSLCEDAHLLNYLNVDYLIEQTESLHCLNREGCCLDIDMDIWAGKEIELLRMIISMYKNRKCGGDEITAVIEQMLGGLANMKDSSSGGLCVSREWFEEKQAEARQEGREEAWDLARRIGTCGDDCYTYDEARDLFESRTFGQILRMPVEEALSKDKEYQEDKKALHVGDEVEFVAPGRTKFKELHKGYVIGIDEESPRWVYILTKDGSYHRSPVMCKKTGKHNPDVEKVMASFEKGE